MTTCFDIYTIQSGCNLVQTYPSQVHPHNRVRPSGPSRRTKPLTLVDPYDDEEAIMLALSLLL